MRLLFLGPPGAGKGTQARELAREWGVPQVATGDMLREQMAAGTPLGREAKQFYEKGDLVPDDVILRMVADRFRQPDAANGFLLDGFPRTIAQADGLAAMLTRLGQKLDAVIYFDVSQPELVRRLTGRRLCRACQTPFHLVSAPPKKAGVCDKCGGELYQREDDAEATVLNRLQVYERQTAPLLEYYTQRGLLRTVSGEGAVDKIRQALREAVGGAVR
ncbi:MAG TPA: adenylate kinase [Terriglobales bacterium]|nr:adenylate kinase [Terriglobales bacterium]